MWSTISNIERRTPSAEQIKFSPRLLIVGEKNTGKTSLAFRMAYEAASEGSIVLFVCLQNKIRNNFPLPVSLAQTGNVNYSSVVAFESEFDSWSPAILSRIMFKYVTNAAELKKLSASMHMLHPRPQCVVIDDFSLIIDPMSTVSRQDQQFAEVCQILGAFIVDAVDYLDKAAAAEQGLKVTEILSPAKLIITSDCLESTFVNMMLRYTGTSLFSRFNTGTEGQSVRGGSGDSNFSHLDNAEYRNGVRITIRNKFAPPGTQDKILFSSVMYSNGRLLCTH